MMILDIGNALEPVMEAENGKDALLYLISPEEFEKNCPPPFQNLPPYTAHDHIRFCKAVPYAGFLLGTFCIPSKGGKGREVSFAFYLFLEKILLVGDPDFLMSLFRQLGKDRNPNRRPITLLRDCMDFLLQNDLQHLESLEEAMERLEEESLETVPQNFSHRMLPLKKEISRFYRYYSQLLNLCTQLSEALEDYGEDPAAFQALISRITLLREETVMLREYSLQIREVYQAQTDIRQNNIMKVLTIVTTIFFPLSVIAGWYGMNFTNMPELRWKYGYPLITAVSLLVVLFCVWLFKKRKFW